MRVLVGCEKSGVVREAFRARGHEAWSCDTEEADDDSPWHIQGDVLGFLNGGWDLGIFHPPCTFLTVTGNKWFYHPADEEMPVVDRRPHPRFPDRLKKREEAAAFFMAIANAPIEKLAIENPVGYMSTAWREPDQIIQPYQFGHVEPKQTCLWLKNLPCLEPTKHVEPDYYYPKSGGKRMPRWYAYADKSQGQAHRASIRSKTFSGIAEAMADQWGEERLFGIAI